MTNTTQKQIKMPSPKTLEFIGAIERQPRTTWGYSNFSLVANPGVFPFERSSRVLADYLPVEKSESTLDMGTGSGIQAIVAYNKGAMSVLGVDIDKKAVNNAVENVRRCGLEKRIKIIQSNLFDNVPRQKFDRILANLPFTNCKYSKKNAHLLFDPEYKIHDKFLRQAKDYLSKNGKIIIVGGELADETSLYTLARKYEYYVQKQTTIRLENIDWKVYELSAGGKR